MNPLQYEHGFVAMTTVMLHNSVNEKNLLSWQLINSSCTRVNKPFVALIQQNAELKM